MTATDPDVGPGAFYFPAYSELLPTLLPARELLAANGVEQALRPVVMQAAGPALAGVLVAAFAPDTGLLAAALAYVLALLPPFAVRDRAGGGPSGYALVLAAYGIGGALGSVAVAARRLPRRYLTTMLVALGAGAQPMVVLGLTDRIWLMAAATFLVGATGGAGTVVWGTLLHRRVPVHLLGRVSSLDFFVSLALLPVSMALAGPGGGPGRARRAGWPSRTRSVCDRPGTVSGLRAP